MTYKLSGEQKNRADERAAAIRASFDTFTKILNIGDSVQIQPKLLDNVVVSWGYDEDRHTEFHPCNIIQLHKSAAFFLYWFVRVKPIQITKNILNINGKVALVNEWFALFRVYAMLGIKQRDIIAEKFNDDFVYTLHYRDIRPEPLFTTIQLLHEIKQLKSK